MKLYQIYLSVLSCFLLISSNAIAQTEADFLPQLKLLAIDSTEDVAAKFCEEVMSAVPGYAKAFVDREDILRSKYVYDDGAYESVKFAFQFTIEDAIKADSTIGKKRVVKLQRITAELSAMSQIYNYLFGTTHTPEKIMAISRYDKDIGYNGTVYTCTISADDFKAGYWVLTIYRLR